MERFDSAGFIARLSGLKPRPTPQARRDSPAYAPTISREEWDAIFQAQSRGVRWAEIFDALPAGTYATLKSFQNAVSIERNRRRGLA